MSSSRGRFLSSWATLAALAVVASALAACSNCCPCPCVPEQGPHHRYVAQPESMAPLFRFRLQSTPRSPVVSTATATSNPDSNPAPHPLVPAPIAPGASVQATWQDLTTCLTLTLAVPGVAADHTSSTVGIQDPNNMYVALLSADAEVQGLVPDPARPGAFLFHVVFTLTPIVGGTPVSVVADF